MKVVINSCFGGFGLSDAAILECVKRGMKMTTYTAEGEYADNTADFIDKGKESFGSRYCICDRSRKEFRTNPIVLEVIEEMEEKANGMCGELKIIEIPFDDLSGWFIDEYDGYESIREEHREWS